MNASDPNGPASALNRGVVLFFLSLVLLLIAPAVGAAATCGAEGQPPCKVWERVPSCDRGLVEDFAKGRCFKPQPRQERVEPPRAKPLTCGREGQRPCTITERIPSCDQGLVEDFAQRRCISRVEATATDAEKRLAAFSRGFNRSYNAHPCSGLSPIGVRPLCALVKALPAEAAGQCMSGLLRKVERELSETGEKVSFNEAKYLNAMELGGNMAYAVALDAAIGAATAGASEAIKPDKLEKIKKVYDFLQDLREAFGALQKAQLGADAIRNELSAIPACRSLL